MNEEEFESCIKKASKKDEIEACVQELPRSYRDYEPNLFKDSYDYCGKHFEEREKIGSCRSGVREKYKRFEAGRFYRGVKNLYDTATHLDIPEVKQFMKDYPETVDMINEYANLREGRRKIGSIVK